uniref:Uncharacterized protein n=1 Tax=Chenopodium quinoa TaxID=63459 RepID=A0A803LYC3_CHEQI
MIGLNASLRSSKVPLMLFLTVQNIGSAMADVVADAMIAEAARFERWAQIALSLLILIDMVLVSRANIAYRISDKMLVLWGTAVADAINQFKLMPFLILSGQLCPPGIEGTLFALFMSIKNFGSTVGSFVGAWLASILNISSGSFDNLHLGIVIQFFCSFIPLAFLFLIPKDATGLSA